MTKRLLLVAAMLAVAALPALAQDNYHYNLNIDCVDCHSMHASAHDNQSGGLPYLTSTDSKHFYPGQNALGGSGAVGDGIDKLLKQAPAALCLTCHGGANPTAPDVEDANTLDGGFIRSAGGVRNADAGGGHRIGSTIVAPGSDGSAYNYGGTLLCQSCHEPHGTATYRNLGPVAMIGSITVAGAAAMPTVTKGAFNNTFDVNVNAAARTTGGWVWGTETQYSDYYAASLITYVKTTPGQTLNDGIAASNRMDLFCGTCHGHFHGGTSPADATVGGSAAGIFKRHPTGIVTNGMDGWAAGTGSNGYADLKVYQVGSGQAPATDSPGCVTCHKAHGNNNPFALIYPNHAGGIDSEEGLSTSTEVKTLCKSCHSQGGNDLDGL